MTYDALYRAYSTVVLEGHAYSIHGFAPGFELEMAFSDPIVSSFAPEKGDDVLALCVSKWRADSSDAPCWLTSGDDRRWLREGSGLLYRAGHPKYQKWSTVGQLQASVAGSAWQTLSLPSGLADASILTTAGQASMADTFAIPEGQVVVSAFKIGEQI